MQNFKEAQLPQALLHRLENMGLITPTPIQAEAIPPALEGRDILGSAQTGTGKTAAFGIPLVTRLMAQPQGTALVLLPTRELAAQVMGTMQKLIGSSKLPTALLIGGEPMSKQFHQLKNRPRLVVGTPGRINDHLKRGTLRLNDVCFMVLDETDRMLDMGFGIQLDAISEHITSEHQTLMFSATMPKNIQKLSAKYLNDPIRIQMGSTEATAPNVTQETVRVSESDKYDRLLNELDTRSGSVIIFVKTKHGADRMADKLCRDGHEADALHGDLRQSKRDRVISDFRRQDYRVLVATDVAARGLDIPHIEHVINYDLPQSPEDYIHRIGRTARAGAKGAALSLLSPQDGSKWRAIQRLINPEFKDEEPANRNNRPRSGYRGSEGGENRRSSRPHRGQGQRRSNIAA